ncbi:helix-turn-helix domain-containing protein [Chryseobacterium sp.]|uniref:helix-turn-helix domain-containing protein n=1 Tax=Chryseobacterium sp. TaxID=1871047 RepID=UPI0033415623
MEIVSKQDLELFRIKLISDIERILEADFNLSKEDFGWLRSKAVRKIMDISPATLQNLRITEKIRFKKVLGSYYYSKEDLLKLFEDEN